MGACCETEKQRYHAEFRTVCEQDVPVEYQCTEDEVQAEQAEWARVEEIWAKYDKNGNGVLNKWEGRKFLSDMLKEYNGAFPTENELSKNFAIMDEDKSGDISKEEALKYIKGYELGQSLKRMMSGTDM